MTGRILVTDIKAVVSAQFAVRVADLVGPRKLRRLTVPRHVGMTLAREMTRLSRLKVARAFGRTDHTTVINAERRACQYEVDLQALKQKVEAHASRRRRWFSIATAPTDGTALRVQISKGSRGHRELPYRVRFADGCWRYAKNNAPVFPWQQPKRWKPVQDEDIEAI